MHELVLQKDGEQAARYVVGPEGLVIGRAPDSSIVLPGQMVSRKHARVWLDDDVVLVEDLGSRNGIGVNGHRVLRAQLSPGDQLMIGDAVFELCETVSSSSISSVISFEKAGTLADEMVRKEGGHLPILYKAARLMGTVFNLDDLLTQILQLIFEALPVRRGFILTLAPDSDVPEIHATMTLEDDTFHGAPLSRTLIRHVFDHKSAMLTLDAMDDSRFGSSKSILQYAIHAAMCAPLIGRQSTVGAIYVDAGSQETMFLKEDLELLTAIAWVVGVAVENARLYKENVDQARLAAIGQATAGVGHCVKNILTGIMGGAQFIDLAIEHREISYLEKGWPIMRRAIERIENLVMNMLTFSRDHKPELAPTDINALVQEVIDTAKSRANRAEVAITAECGDVGFVSADSREIYRVLLNLLLNGIDACERRAGAVEIKTYSAANGCYVDVKDNGTGISPDVQPKLFQAFATSKGSSGTGLGLACSYKIIHEHGGTITVQSEPDKGTVFTVFLPYRSAKQG